MSKKASSDFAVDASWATEPFFSDAPHPEQWTPFQYQHAGVEYALARDHALFGDAPGLGKTAECILLGNAIGARRSLVICPASLRLNWEREIWRWSLLPNVSTYPIFKASDGVSHQHDYVIISYSLVSNPSIFKALTAQLWDHVILDEAHALKDPKKNKRVRAICDDGGIKDFAGRITMASGTILPNQPIECLGADTLVLTDRGWLPIVDVSKTHKVWDGREWVKHQGLIQRGIKQVGQWCGITMTLDHPVLAGGNWYSAERLGNADILRRALVTGSENLPLLAWTMDQRAGSCVSWWRVRAARPLITLVQRIYGAAFMDAVHVVPGKALAHAGKNTRVFAQTLTRARDYLAAYKISWGDAITRGTPAIAPTAGEVSPYIFPGSEIGLNFWPIWYHWTGGITRRLRLIGSKMKKVISPVIFALQRGSKTPAINGSFGSFSNESTSWKPVYDLVNAGPRKRFTVLSSSGPLIVHNCYNAIRLLNWEAINKASLESFRDTYYDKGSGMIHGPVLKYTNDGQPYTVRELHWSNQVRNVPRNLDDLQFRLRSSIMVRRLKSQVLTQLPPKQWHVFPMAITSEMREALKHPGWAEAEALYELDPEAFDRGIPVDGAISTAMRLLGEAAAPSVAEYIDQLFEEGIQKLVVCGWHRSVLDYLRERLKRHGLVYMDGSTSDRQKQAAVDRFQTEEEIGIILGQMIPLGEGWTLTQAQDAVFAESFWVPGKMDQLLDRIHRVGQQGDYIIGHVPIAPGTLQERMLGTLVEKEQSIHAALDYRHGGK